MVDVKNKLLHMVNQCVSIDGRTYKTDAEGIIRGMPEEDANQLLSQANGPWSRVTAREPVTPARPVVPPPVSAPPPPPAPELPKKLVEAPKVAAEVAPSSDPAEEWVLDESMTMVELKRFAKEHGITYDPKADKKHLLARVKSAMAKKEKE